MKCPKCGGKHVYVMNTFYPEDYTDVDNTPETEFQCANCGHKSTIEADWTEDAL
jgi:predicted RNA-binding Zn-ribbon protein involved in translation (DUF1610 family)